MRTAKCGKGIPCLSGNYQGKKLSKFGAMPMARGRCAQSERGKAETVVVDCTLRGIHMITLITLIILPRKRRTSAKKGTIKMIILVEGDHAVPAPGWGTPANLVGS